MNNRNLIELLSQEMDDAWNTLQQSLDGLTEPEFWWKPSKNAWTLRKIKERWSLDSDYPIPIPKGSHTIAWLIVHLAMCKIMYVEYAFGNARMVWDDLSLPSDLVGAVICLEQGHMPLRAALEDLNNEDLPQLRKTNWGELWTTDRIIWTMIHHDIYHGAQIQVIRKIFQDQYPK